jgi:hypothetical protein
MAAVGCFAVPFTFGPESFGLLLRGGGAGALRGAGPIVDVAVERTRGIGGEGGDC